ncbi:MAG: hypothetical protein ACODAA_05015 [Gemmatimonadota bacterium]
MSGVLGALGLLLAGGAPPVAAQDAPLASVPDTAQAPPPHPFASVLAGIPEPQLREALTESMAMGPRLTPSEVSVVMTKWRETAGGPANGSGWLLAARLWRQAGEPDSAVTRLQRADKAGGLPGGMLSLEAARTGFLSGHPGAAGAYWEGCGEADPDVLAEYWRDFAGLATPAEAAGWSAIDSVPAERRPDVACDLLQRAWSQRAAQAGLSVAQRLDLHFERLRYVRTHYYLVGSEGNVRLGPRTRLLSVQVGRPQDAELDDRGLLYLRFGEPDRTASFGGVQNETRRSLPSVNLVVSPTCYHPNVTWAYDFPDGVRLYHLSPLEGTANWWLLENLHDLYRCGDPSNADDGTLTPVAVGPSAPIGEIAWLVLPDLYLSRSGLDPRYATASHRIVSSGPTDENELEGLRNVGLGRMTMQQEFTDERRVNFEMTEDVLTRVHAKPDVRRELSFIHTVLQFRAARHPNGELTRVWLNAMVEGERLEGLPAPDVGLAYAVEATLSALSEGSELHQKTASFRLSAPRELDDEAGVPVRLALDLPPGEYSYSLVVRDANDGEPRPAGNWMSDSLRVRRYDARLPQLSDIAFAPDSGGAWSPAPGVALPVTPVNITDQSGRAWLYFEAYGLSPRGEYVTEIRMEPRDGGEAFSLTYRGSAPAAPETAAHRVLRLDLGDTEPGEYGATITVTDGLGRRSLPIETSLVVR